MLEHFFQCPYCWERISVLLEPEPGRRRYIEDCEICCNPLEIQVEISQREIVFFEASEIGQ